MNWPNREQSGPRRTPLSFFAEDTENDFGPFIGGQKFTQ